MRPLRLTIALTAAVAAALLVALPAAGASAWQIAHVNYRGIRHLHLRYGPLHINPGQNIIALRTTGVQKPRVPGYITRFQPNITYLDGKVPRTDVIHLHHGVWIINGYPTFAAGEEKTVVQLPRGYGYPFKPSDTWWINDMIHDLTPSPANVYITYDIDFVPASAPAAKRLKPVRTVWLDVKGIQFYPVFDVIQGSGHHGRYTFPDDAPPGSAGFAQKWTVDRDGTLVGAAGHLHPGGLWTDLKLTRNGRTVELFRSRAHYFEPAGAVSWDVAMSVPRPDWRVRVRKGDVLSVSGTYDSSRASWYESMAIMPVAFSPGDRSGVDPFTHRLDMRGVLTHGHLPENDNHGGGPFGLPDARSLLNGPESGGVTISDFVYGQGDLSLTGAAGRPPVVREGQALTFLNADARRNIFHTITACRSPCNRSTGIAYPLANGSHPFDSGQLGYGPAGFTAAANRNTWSTPTDLPPGTYTYFCRIHPFMRGSFRIIP